MGLRFQHWHLTLLNNILKNKIFGRLKKNPYIYKHKKQTKMAKTEKQFAQHLTHTSYYATTDGEVISFKGKQPKFIIQCKHGRGYTQFMVSENGKTKSYLTHRFIYESFYGEIPEGMQIHHIDHDKENNVLDNLQMVTDEENKLHSRMAGRPQGGLASKLLKQKKNK